MADIDFDPFGDHESRTEESMGESIPLIPGEEGVSTWEPECEQETSFGGGRTHKGRLTVSYVDSLYKPSKHYSRTSDATHYDNFRHEGRWLYFKGRDEPLTNEDGKLRTFGKLKSIPSKNRICNLGFDISKGPKVQQAVVLNKAKEELPSMSDIAKEDDIELQEIMENASRSMENLNQQPEGESSEDLPMCKLLGLDKQLRSIRGSLKVEVTKKVQLEESIKKKKRKLEEFREHP